MRSVLLHIMSSTSNIILLKHATFAISFHFRLKKKARLQVLLEIEGKYNLLREIEALNQDRCQSLVKYVNNIGNASNSCHHASKLMKLASRELTKPEFSVTDAVTLTAENSGVVKVQAQGTDLESGDPKVISGMICVDFAPKSASIDAVSLYWSANNATSSLSGMVPSISALSFET